MVSGSPKPLVIIGAGGFGREVAWLVKEINDVQPEWDFLGFVDDHATGRTIEGYPILGTTAWLKEAGHDRSVHVVCAIGDPRTRRRVVDPLEAAGLSFATLVHPSVRSSRWVEVGAGSIICAGTILTTNIQVGKHSILNLGCRVGHDTTLGDFCSMMPGTNIAGEVTVGEGCYFGLNACVINRTRVGEWSIIGAGAAVVRDIPPRVVAVGVPAKPIKTIEE